MVEENDKDENVRLDVKKKTHQYNVYAYLSNVIIDM